MTKDFQKSVNDEIVEKMRRRVGEQKEEMEGWREEEEKEMGRKFREEIREVNKKKREGSEASGIQESLKISSVEERYESDTF